MTREELFSVFPRPWRLSTEDIGVVLDADGKGVITVDVNGERDDEDVIALAEVLTDIGNDAEVDGPPSAGADLTGLIEHYVCELAELPNRTSPADQPDMLLVSPNELRKTLRIFVDEVRALDQGE